MTDTFRQERRDLTIDEKAMVLQIKNQASLLEGMMKGSFKEGVHNREMALALTNLEQCIMWAVKAITK